jgi:hypothetical protein
MYRPFAVSVIFLAFVACGSGAKTTSAVSSSSSTTDQATQLAAGQPSDTANNVAGPNSTTDASGTSYATNSTASPNGAAGSGSVNSGSSSGPASRTTAWPGKPNPNRVPNEMGRIMVLEYHLITDHNGDYARERGQFRKDLELLYDRGYRPVNMSDVLDKNLNLPKGLSPVVFTFDDASPEQFSYINNNGKLEIDPNSGVGIWLDFKKTHPDWNNKAVYCLLSGAQAGHNFFGDRGIKGQLSNWRFQKVKWLADNGFELCDHTLWHAQLSKYPDAFVQEQIARNALAIDSAVPGYKIRSMALPQGLWPKNRALASRGSWTNP